MIRLATDEPGFAAAWGRLLQRAAQTTADVAGPVAAIIAEVRAHGDAALCALTTRFDRFALTIDRLRITPSEIAAAEAAIPAALRDALDTAARRIAAFHEAQLPRDVTLADPEGLSLGLRWGPVDAVGLYVPGGTAAYPSSVLMNAVPARVAGVGRIAMCVPTPDDHLAPAVLAAASRAGVSEIWRIGGAQAIAALAYGTASIAPVDRIVGPGNRYVAEAKRQVFGVVGIDSVAGPSEVLVIADDTADPTHIARDLLAQAEHDALALCVLVTPSAALADRVAAAVAAMLPGLERSAIAEAAWGGQGAIVVTRDLAEAAAISDQMAPEHLQLMTADPRALFARIRHAGSVFLGNTPTALGDYVAGPNHVLPTGGAARFSSGLSVFDFLKRTTWTEAEPAGMAHVAPAAITLARAEGLHAHADSLACRLA